MLLHFAQQAPDSARFPARGQCLHGGDRSNKCVEEQFMSWTSRVGTFPAGFVAAVLALMLLLSACGGDDNGGDDPPTATPEAQAVEPTATATSTPEPTATPEATATSTPEPTPTPTPYQAPPTVAAPIYQPPAPPPVPPTREPEPTPVQDEPAPTVPPEDQDAPVDVPDEGETEGLLLIDDLTGFFAQENEIGFGYVGEFGYHIVIDNDSTGREYWDISYTQEQYADVVAMIDVRHVAGSANSFACLALRTAPDGWSSAYALCITGDGNTFADFKYVDGEGNYLYEEIVEFGLREGTAPPTEWNTLTIVAYGQDLGFLVNDEVIGVAIHPSIEAGGVAFLSGNWGEEPPEWAFTNLQVWQIE
jgi:hypothetical protein